MPSPEHPHESFHPERSLPYWTIDEQIGELHIQNELYSLRIRVHMAEEHYRRRKEIIPISQDTGTSFYIHAQPYILLPDITVTVATYPQPAETGAIGEVIDASWNGMRHQDVGQAQAWSYPADKTIILWECYLNDWLKQEDPRGDSNLSTFWQGFEAFLVKHQPQTEQIVTPAWEPLYERAEWQEFLQQQGYRPINHRAWGKAIAD